MDPLVITGGIRGSVEGSKIFTSGPGYDFIFHHSSQGLESRPNDLQANRLNREDRPAPRRRLRVTGLQVESEIIIRAVTQGY